MPTKNNKTKKPSKRLKKIVRNFDVDIHKPINQQNIKSRPNASK